MLRSARFAFVIASIAATFSLHANANSDPNAPAIGRRDAGGRKCLGTKLHLIAKKEAGLLACQAAVAKTGKTTALAACEAKVKTKFATAFAKAGSCAGDAATCESLADICETAVTGAISGALPSKCTAAKRKTAGLYASGLLACYAKSASSGAPVVASCLTKAANKFSTALGKAGSCADGGSPQVLVATVCVDAVATTDGSGAVTDVCATASSSSTTTSTISSSTTVSGSSTTSTTHAPICEAPNEIGCTDLTQGCLPCSATGGSCAQACQYRCQFGFADGGACANCLADLCAPACCH